MFLPTTWRLTCVHFTPACSTVRSNSTYFVWHISTLNSQVAKTARSKMRKPKSSKKKAKKPILAVPEAEAEPAPAQPAVWRPGVDGMEEDEALEYDPTAYDCLHPFSTEWPSLSFEVLRDDLGAERIAFPHTLFMAVGSQAGVAKSNSITLLRLRGLNQGRHGKKALASDSDSEIDSEEEVDSDNEEPMDPSTSGRGPEGAPVMHSRSIAHQGTINRLRAMPQQQSMIAVWADSGQVKVYDLSVQLQELATEAQPRPISKNRPLQLAPRHAHSHPTEGYALDWSPVVAGQLAAGDNRGKIHVWAPQQGAVGWNVSGAYQGHEASVEEIQWSPTEASVFASGSSDKTIRIWDTRERSKPMLTVAAHDADVNVMSWNRGTTFMLASGGDDCALRVWDLRNFKDGSFVANFTYHRRPITSVEWCPHDSSTLLTTSADNQLAVWDLALERDPEEEMAMALDTNAAVPEDIPPQLMFVHAGQTDIKEGHWHPQIPGLVVSTAADGFNVFKPSNLFELP